MPHEGEIRDAVRNMGMKIKSLEDTVFKNDPNCDSTKLNKEQHELTDESRD